MPCPSRRRSKAQVRTARRSKPPKEPISRRSCWRCSAGGHKPAVRTVTLRRPPGGGLLFVSGSFDETSNGDGGTPTARHGPVHARDAVELCLLPSGGGNAADGAAVRRGSARGRQ